MELITGMRFLNDDRIESTILSTFRFNGLIMEAQDSDSIARNQSDLAKNQ